MITKTFPINLLCKPYLTTLFKIIIIIIKNPFESFLVLLKAPNRRRSKFHYNMGGHGPKGKVKCGTYLILVITFFR